MTTDVLLFILRIISASLLILLLLSLLWIIWRDYRATLRDLESRRRSYGYLVLLQEIEGNYHPIGKKYPLLPLTSLGRAPTNTVIIEDDFASSEHALLAMRNGQWWLEDRQSRNGTTLNDIPVYKPMVITNGDIIGVGHLYFRLDLER